MSRSMLLAVLMLAGCAKPPSSPAPPAEDLQPAMVVGSAQTPDPVLERVRALERAGVVRDVVVHESFPVQIHLRATAQTMEELNRIPRRRGRD